MPKQASVEEGVEAVVGRAATAAKAVAKEQVRKERFM
jgi:hypothetical protein